MYEHLGNIGHPQLFLRTSRNYLVSNSVFSAVQFYSVGQIGGGLAVWRFAYLDHPVDHILLIVSVGHNGC